MSNAVTYEIFVFYNGQWKLDSMYDNHEIALFEAQRVLQGPRCMGIRVAEQRFRDATATYATRTIFRKTKIDGVNNDGVEREKKIHRDAELRAGGARSRAVESYGDDGGAAVAPIDYGLLFRLVLGAAIILAGIAAILALRSFE